MVPWLGTRWRFSHPVVKYTVFDMLLYSSCLTLCQKLCTCLATTWGAFDVGINNNSKEFCCCLRDGGIVGTQVSRASRSDRGHQLLTGFAGAPVVCPSLGIRTKCTKKVFLHTKYNIPSGTIITLEEHSKFVPRSYLLIVHVWEVLTKSDSDSSTYGLQKTFAHFLARRPFTSKNT